MHLSRTGTPLIEVPSRGRPSIIPSVQRSCTPTSTPPTRHRPAARQYHRPASQAHFH